MNIYVENLDFSVDTVDLTMHFAQYGLVTEVKLVTDKFSGRSKGFAFIEMPNDEEAVEAINASQGFDMNGKAMVVSEAKPRLQDVIIAAAADLTAVVAADLTVAAAAVASIAAVAAVVVTTVAVTVVAVATIAGNN
ncbi:RNA-binding protein [Chitinophaga sedimenti]|uniref:RNA recognition motif domain-containing protein n=1 Tax=Chitinophaga sedimenti TaxID=2033606 RepID=UPI0020065359|nr:RNA-binding protein [Chitinophaga sedimenti]MCK7556037.1 RNA-binding protein [Chitinophaga sedimenti]